MDIINSILPQQIIALRYLIKSGYCNLTIILLTILGSISGIITIGFTIRYYLVSFKCKYRIKRLPAVLILAFVIIMLSISMKSSMNLLSRIYLADGYISLQLGKYIEASNALRKSILLDKNLLYGYDLLIKVYMEINDSLNVLGVLEKKVKVNQTYENLIKLANICKKMGYYNKSLIFFDLAKETKNRDVSEISIGIAEILIQKGLYQRAISELSECQENAETRFYIAKSFFQLKKLNESLNNIESAISKDSCNFKYWILRGNILSKMKSSKEALQSFDQAIWLKKELPLAYLRKAEVLYDLKQYESCHFFLHKALYYNNSYSKAYLLKKAIEKKLYHDRNLIKEFETKFRFDQRTLNVIKGEKKKVNFEIAISTNYRNFQCVALEPFGFGFFANIIEIERIKTNSKILIKGVLEIVGMRDTSVNLGNPWVLNFVVFNIKEGVYNSQKLNIYVRDKEEGNIFLTVTEDLEENSDFPHNNDLTPTIQDLDPVEAKKDLILKSTFADSILNNYGIRWSHFIDIGSAFKRVKWAANISKKLDWKNVWTELSYYYHNTLHNGNDIQLHIHSYNIPKSTNFNQEFDTLNDKVIFRKTPDSLPYSDGRKGAWAHEYRVLGNFKSPNSRIGSIYQGIRGLEGQFCPFKHNYRTIIFRAGEYEFGNSHAEMRKSIISLRKNKILCSSNASRGKINSREFIFSKPIGKNIYFTSHNDIKEKAKDILDIGILEIVPIPRLYTGHYLEPVDDPINLKIATNLLLDKNGMVIPGVHVIMEMYHMFTFNWKTKWDSLDANYGDWLKLRKHMKYVKTKCKKIKPAKISDIVIAYLEYYSPDIICLRTNENKINDYIYQYDLLFIGNDIKIDQDRRHFCSVKPPSYFLGRIKKVTLLKDNCPIRTWDNVTDYNDLNFEIDKKSGYSLTVKINKI